MKQRTRNKLISMLLVFCMLLSLLPSSVIAAGEPEQTGVLQPVTPAVTGETVAAAAPSSPMKLAESCNILRYVNEEVFMQSNHIARLQKGHCTIEMGFVLSDILTNCERVSDHCSNIAVAQIETEQNAYEAHEYLNGIKSSGNAEYLEAFDAYRARYTLN